MDANTTSLTPPPPAAPLPDIDEIVRKADQQSRQLASLKDATSSFLRRDARLGQLRERTLLLRSRAKFEWNNCHNYRQFVKQSQEAFNEGAAAIMNLSASEEYGERLDRLRSLHDQVMRDFEAQNEYAERSNALQTELGELEFELQKKEISVKEAGDTMKQILSDLVLPGYSSAATAVESELPPSPSTQHSEQLDPLIENYFQKVGNVNNLLEQINEFNVDYVDAHGERLFKVDHEQALDLSDEDFERLWQEGRERMDEQLAEAERQAENARIACLDNGLDPEKQRLRPQRESDRSLPDSPQDEIAELLDLDIGVNAGENTGYLALGPPLHEEKGGFPIRTPGTLLSRTSHEQPPEMYMPVPLNDDRVLDWIQHVDGDGQGLDRPLDPMRPHLPPRRSVSISSPFHPTSKGGPFRPPQPETWVGNELRSVQDTLEVGQWANERQRRRSSDSRIMAMQDNHDPNPEYMETLRKFDTARLQPVNIE